MLRAGGLGFDRSLREKKERPRKHTSLERKKENGAGSLPSTQARESLDASQLCWEAREMLLRKDSLD